MLISEIFYSLQGEGQLSGVPSVFVRTSGCNLRCTWCDTRYASWEPEGQELSVAQILTQVEAFGAAHVVLTGGEPMVAKEIRALAQGLRQRGKHITIETAATVLPEGIACDLASLSPKLANSVPDGRLWPAWRRKHEALRYQPEVISSWLKAYDYQLKFVVTGPTDVAELQVLLGLVDLKISPSKVLLMPEGTSTAVLQQRSQKLVELCKRFGYRYCSRLHVELFGQTRGT